MTWYDKAITNTILYVVCAFLRNEWLAYRYVARYNACCRRRARARAEARAWLAVHRWIVNETNRPR